MKTDQPVGRVGVATPRISHGLKTRMPSKSASANAADAWEASLSCGVGGRFSNWTSSSADSFPGWPLEQLDQRQLMSRERRIQFRT